MGAINILQNVLESSFSKGKVGAMKTMCSNAIGRDQKRQFPYPALSRLQRKYAFFLQFWWLHAREREKREADACGRLLHFAGIRDSVKSQHIAAHTIT